MLSKKREAYVRFQKRFPNATVCYEHLFKIKWPEGFICPACNHSEYYKVPKRNHLQCKRCGHQTSVTAGTVMHRTRTSLHHWFWLIYWVLENSRENSPSQVSKALGINYHLVRRIVAKIKKDVASKGVTRELHASFIKPDDSDYGREDETKSNNQVADKGQMHKSFDPIRRKISGAVPINEPDSPIRYMDSRIGRINISGYKISELIHLGKSSTMFRAIRERDTRRVLVRIASTSKFQSRLRHEYEMIKNLDADGILRPYELSYLGKRLALVYEDPGGYLLRKYLNGKGMTIQDFLPLALSLTRILEEIHRRNIIHKSVTPENILFNPKKRLLRLSGLDRASRLSVLEETSYSSEAIEGNMAYLSPEQTGRVHCTLDYRTDFYSLGVVFYEALVGRLPFQFEDPLELLHSLLAKDPVPPHQIDSTIPVVLSEIVTKLMAKNVDERYQSAAGLKGDLDECVRRFQSKGSIDAFPIGRLDFAERLQIAKGPYGREREIQFLQEAFQRVCKGRTEVVMVTGYSGTGKTTLVRGLYKSSTEKTGLFVSGKFDQLQQNVPYSGVISAFKELVWELLNETAARLNMWKDKILNAIGGNGQIIIEVIPELEQIIGTQPPVPELGPMESLNRFSMVFRSFFSVFAKKDHPLVVFLDDLQWVDTATLDLLKLMTGEGAESLLLIGAYRENEVEAFHPLRRTLKTVKDAGALVSNIHLDNLKLQDVSRLLMDTLRTEPKEIGPLSILLWQRTNGNPFFISQFLETVYLRKQIRFDLEMREWKWDIDSIRSVEIPGNVVELLLGRLDTLPEETQEILSLAACIGSQFDVDTLTLISDKNISHTLECLAPAIREGLLIPASGRHRNDRKSESGGKNICFSFLHDRVQQATYALIDAMERKSVHQKIGRILLKHAKPHKMEENIFSICRQFNIVTEYLIGQEERKEVSYLNFIAGKKANASSAFGSAFQYLRTAISLLPDDCWCQNYEKTLALYNEAASAACVIGNFEGLQEIVQEVIRNSKNTLDKVQVYRNQILGYTAENRFSESVATGLEILRLLGLKISRTPSRSEADSAMNEVREIVLSKGNEELLTLPKMTDPTQLAIARILADTGVSAYFIRFELMVIAFAKEMLLTLQSGYTHVSPYFYCCYGLYLCGTMKDIDEGYRVGSLGMTLLQQTRSIAQQAQITYVYNKCVRHFKEPVGVTLGPLEEAFEVAKKFGDTQYGGYSGYGFCAHAYLAGKELSWVSAKMNAFNIEIRKINNITAIHLLEIYQQSVQNLTGQSSGEWLLNGDVYDEERRLPVHQLASDRLSLFLFHFNKLILCFLFEQYEEANVHSNLANEYRKGALGMMSASVYFFLDSLVKLTVYPFSSEEERKEILNKVDLNQRRLDKLAHHAPSNYRHKYHLIEAERMKVLGQDMGLVIDHYDKGIALAKEGQFLNDEALGNELAAKFCILMGKDRFAGIYFQQAYDCYEQWGANQKIAHLQKKYGAYLSGSDLSLESLGEKPSDADSIMKGTQRGTLDMVTVMKASQAISREIEPANLTRVFMKILLENVGAQKGFLILRVNGELVVEARGGVDEEAELIRPSVPIKKCGFVPTSIIEHVEMKQQSLVLKNASEESMFNSDPYIVSRKPKSVLCTPISKKTEISGILYLENNLVPSVFTPQRLRVVHFLASQIAISQENAQLIARLTATERKYRGIFENAMNGIYQTTQDGRFKTANNSMAWMFGFDSPQSLMEEVENIEQMYVDPERRGELLELLERNEKVNGFEVEFYRKDGTKFWSTLDAFPVQDEEGRLAVIEGILTDVTDKKREIDALRNREGYLREENRRLRSTIKDRYKFGRIVGRSPAMQEVYELIVQAAASDASVIIYGETGTGKGLVARAIHDMSERKNGKFVPVNCGAIPDSLAESEFFGHKKGAFTGAVADRAGYLDVANDGTIFLDELGEVGLGLQAKLLRAIEGEGYMPVGGTALRNTSARIIAATNRDLKRMVKKGLMREDFFYRVHVIPIYLPPLREHTEDIPLLIDHFLKSMEHTDKTRPIKGEVLAAMLDYDWPGNVRELQNTLHRYVALNQLDLLGGTFDESKDENIFGDEADGQILTLQRLEKKHILRLLNQFQWNKSKVASVLGIGRKTLYRKIEDYGLKGDNMGQKTI